MPPAPPSLWLPVEGLSLSWAGADCTVAARGNVEQCDESQGLPVVGCSAFGLKNAYACGETATGLTLSRPWARSSASATEAKERRAKMSRGAMERVEVVTFFRVFWLWDVGVVVIYIGCKCGRLALIEVNGITLFVPFLFYFCFFYGLLQFNDDIVFKLSRKLESRSYL